MRASEYIQRLQKLIAEYGDLELVDAQDNAIGDPDFNDDTGVAAFVVT